MTNTNSFSLRITQVSIPSHGQFGPKTLWTCPDVAATGLCADRLEAVQRAETLITGKQPRTSAPDGQANEAEMACAAEWVRNNGIRDGGVCRRTIEEALDAGIHTVEWAMASAYIMAGWAPYAVVSGRPKFVGH